MSVPIGRRMVVVFANQRLLVLTNITGSSQEADTTHLLQ